MNNNTPEQFFASAIAHYDKGEFDQAIANFTQAIALKPDYADAYNHRGLAYGRKGENDQAIADFTTAIALNPDHAEALYNRGVIYRAIGKEKEAVKDFQQANQLDPTLVIGITKEHRDKVKEAKDFQSIFQQLECDCISLENRWSRYFLGAVMSTLVISIVLLPIVYNLGDPYNIHPFIRYAMYAFCLLITMLVFRQYIHAKQLRIDASNRLAMAKIFTHVHPENISDYKKFNSSLINAIIYSLHNTQTQNINDSSTFIERIVHKK